MHGLWPVGTFGGMRVHTTPPSSQPLKAPRDRRGENSWSGDTARRKCCLAGDLEPDDLAIFSGAAALFHVDRPRSVMALRGEGSRVHEHDVEQGFSLRGHGRLRPPGLADVGSIARTLAHVVVTCGYVDAMCEQGKRQVSEVQLEGSERQGLGVLDPPSPAPPRTPCTIRAVEPIRIAQSLETPGPLSSASTRSG